MKKIFVNTIPQDTEYHKSFNVLVPIEIQGKEGILLAPSQRSNERRGSISARIRVDEKNYFVPSWAVTIKKTEANTEAINYSI